MVPPVKNPRLTRNSVCAWKNTICSVIQVVKLETVSCLGQLMEKQKWQLELTTRLQSRNGNESYMDMCRHQTVASSSQPRNIHSSESVSAATAQERALEHMGESPSQNQTHMTQSYCLTINFLCIFFLLGRRLPQSRIDEVNETTGTVIQVQ